ncbi:TetR/AcrR family transcriptional regulator [Saccharopolyspora rosea]|uniref:TetR/AcrR family transcriptional regulator n=1 Tax=Saccharopolyspora rosea TaxID=524884 RepID=A0ABW3FT67_9PSEU|nr:TetR/AcrR family transcriptional regulator [Saccharopolyspora rosea]
MPRPTDRGDRILDAAGALMLRHGYRKVTVEDVAKQAGVGKGTVYLHWRTKEALFEALILRESVDLIDELVAALRRAPEEVLPHRFLRRSFLAAIRRPLMHALITGDTELLGNLKRGSLRGQELLAGDQYFALLDQYGLLRTDVPDLRYALGAVVTGFYLVDNLNPESADLDEEAKANALEHAVRTSFEPESRPDRAALATAAAEVAALLEGLTDSYRKWIYEHDPSEPG